MTHWGATRKPFDLDAARQWIKGVLSVGFMAALHKAKMVETLDDAQFDKCGICGKSMLHGRGRRKRNLEHVWPKGQGGYDGPGNFMAAHVSCNAGKGGQRPSGCQIIMLVAVCERLDIPVKLKPDMNPWRLPPPRK